MKSIGLFIRSSGNVTLLLTGLFLFVCNIIIAQEKFDLQRNVELSLPEENEATKVKPLFLYPDTGSWLGTRVGFQTNGVSLHNSWAFSVFYEERAKSAFSFVFDFHLWKHLFETKQNNTTYQSFSNKWDFTVGIKARFHVHESLLMNGQAGGGFGEYGFYNIAGFYSIGIEYQYSDRMIFVLSQKKNWFPDINHFLCLGVTISASTIFQQH